MKNEPVILEAIRTPLGKRDGTLSSVRPDVLLATVVNELLARTKISPEKVDDLIAGCVTQANEQGANIARLSVLLSKLPARVPGVSLNRMCGSSQQAIHFAAQSIAAGDADYVIGAGVESMSRVPMFSDIGGGFQTLNPELFKKYEIIHQGESAERIAEKFKIDREQVDAFSIESHERATRATKDGFFKREIVPVEGKTKEGQTTRLEFDEGIRFQIDRAKIAKLPPAFRKDGVVTAANSSQISDGAAGLLLGNREKAVSDGFRPRARFRARLAVGGDPTLQLLEVIPATERALKKAGLQLKDIDVIEINEAFASVVLGWAQAMNADLSKVNPNGGAIAHGHPLGATGAVLMSKLLHELERRNAALGLQVMCIGHGMATATVIERI